MISRAIFQRILSQIKVGGLVVHYPDGTSRTYGPDEPYLEVAIKHPRAIRAILRNPPLGFGESYMNGDLDIIGDIRQPGHLVSDNAAVFAKMGRLQLGRSGQPNRRHLQRQQIAHHYDIGNNFYKLWLDKSMTYSCAYFRKPTDSLELAQDQKIDHILRKLQLKPGQSLLDIGCGWGKLLITAAGEYGVRGHGITLSAEQHKLATERVAAAGLADKITIELINYQDLAERDLQFDRIVSVGMYEHVGRGNHASYFRAVRRLLAPDGLSLLHTITAPGDREPDPWTSKYIFPGGFIPSVAGTQKILEDTGFELQDYENLRFHYALTLEEWLRRFESHRPEVIKMFDERFYRMWRLYLGNSINGFRRDGLGLSQFVFTRPAQPWLPLTRYFLYRSTSGR